MNPAGVLRELAAELRDEGSVISPHVRVPKVEPALGLLAAAGARAAEAPTEYARIVETVREGYLLHYGEPRVLAGADPDLALLAGDYLYALGLERLAALGDLLAVRELADLISLSAQLHAGGAAAGTVERPGDTAIAGHAGPLGEPSLGAAPALWLSTTVAVTSGPAEGHQAVKDALREGSPDAAARLVEDARLGADSGGIGTPLAAAWEAIGLDPPTPRENA